MKDIFLHVHTIHPIMISYQAVIFHIPTNITINMTQNVRDVSGSLPKMLILTHFFQDLF